MKTCKNKLCNNELTGQQEFYCCRQCLEKHRDHNRYKQKRATFFNLTLEELEHLLRIDSCESCGDPISGKNQHIDHCHTTGDVRGVLCRSCNVALGHLKDDPVRIANLITYLLR